MISRYVCEHIFHLLLLEALHGILNLDIAAVFSKILWKLNDMNVGKLFSGLIIKAAVHLNIFNLRLIGF